MMDSAKFRVPVVVIAAIAVALACTSAAGASGTDVLVDCNNNDGLTRKYSAAELRSALSNIGADQDEYSDCRSIIQAELLAVTRRNQPKPPDPNKPLSKAAKAKLLKSLSKEQKSVSGGVNTDTAGTPVSPGEGRTL